MLSDQSTALDDLSTLCHSYSDWFPHFMLFSKARLALEPPLRATFNSVGLRVRANRNARTICGTDDEDVLGEGDCWNATPPNSSRISLSTASASGAWDVISPRTKGRRLCYYLSAGFKHPRSPYGSQILVPDPRVMERPASLVADDTERSCLVRSESMKAAPRSELVKPPLGNYLQHVIVAVSLWYPPRLVGLPPSMMRLPEMSTSQTLIIYVVKIIFEYLHRRHSQQF